MPDYSKVGSPTGAGNPPGEYSDSYLDNPGMDTSHFVDDKAYRGSMNVGRNESADIVGLKSEEESSREMLGSIGNPAIPGGK